MIYPIVFIHGSGGTGEVWHAQRAAFPQAHAPSLPGHTTPGAPISIAEFVEFLHDYIGRLGTRKAITVGNSLGGAITMLHALQYPAEVAATVVIGSGAKLRVAPRILAGLEANFDAAATELASSMFAAQDAELQAEIVAQMQRVGRDQTLRDFRACDAFDVSEQLPAFAVPFLAITGSKDAMTPPKYGMFLRDRIIGGQYREIEGAGHLAMLEAPELVNAALSEFIDRLH